MELFKLFGTIAINNSDANKSIQDTTGQASKAEGTMSKAFKKIGTAVVAAFAVDKIVDFGKACVESAASVKAMESQFEQTFTQKGIDLTDEAAEAIKRVATESNILDTRLKGVGTSIYAFAKTTGMESTEALGMMERALKVTADSAAYYDRSLEDTSESLKSFLKGNYENDSALGLSCTEVTRNTAAMKKYGKSFQELSEAEKQLTLLQMVEDANELSGALGQASREGSGWENVVGNMKEAWNQFKAVVGTPVMEKLIPVIETMTDKMSSLTEKMKDSSFEDFPKKIAKILPEGTKERLGTIATSLETMSTKMKDSVFQTFSTNFGKIKDTIQATSPFIQQIAENYLSMLLDRFEMLTNYIANYVAPAFNLIGTILTDVGTTIWTAIAPYIAKISELFADMSSSITTVVNEHILPTAQSFIAMVQELWNENQDKITKIGTIFSKVFSLIEKIISNGVDKFKKYILPFVTWFVEVVQKNLGNIKSIFQSMFDGIGYALDFFIALFEGDFKGMVQAIVNIATNLKEMLLKVFNLILSVLESWAEHMVTSIASKFTSMIEKVKTTIKDGLEAIKGFFKNIEWKLPDIKLPHFKFNGKFDLSEGKVPSIDVEWYAKGAVLNQPTLFGINQATGAAMVGGEAGKEAVAPIDVLMGYVRQAVTEANSSQNSNEMIELLQQQNELLMAMLRKDTSLKIDGREFGRMVNKYA